MFFSLGEKYLIYWRKTIKLIFGYDIKEELGYFFYKESYNNDFLGEDVDYIRKLYTREDTPTSKMIEIWQKELQDKIIWKVFYKNNYEKHLFIDSMYTSLKNDKTLHEQ